MTRPAQNGIVPFVSGAAGFQNRNRAVAVIPLTSSSTPSTSITHPYTKANLFCYKGTSCEIDLGEKNEAALDKALTKYIGAPRRPAVRQHRRVVSRPLPAACAERISSRSEPGRVSAALSYPSATASAPRSKRPTMPRGN